MLKLKMFKTLGSFACCPIFFSKIMGFTLYFKGQYTGKKGLDFGTEQGNPDYRYYVYPVYYDSNKDNGTYSGMPKQIN